MEYLKIGMAALAAAIVVLGTSIGIGNLTGQATQAISRQPEAGARIQTVMILGAALIEGVAFFCAVICLLVVLGG